MYYLQTPIWWTSQQNSTHCSSHEWFLSMNSPHNLLASLSLNTGQCIAPVVSKDDHPVNHSFPYCYPTVFFPIESGLALKFWPRQMVVILGNFQGQIRGTLEVSNWIPLNYSSGAELSWQPASLLWAAQSTWRNQVWVFWSILLMEFPVNSHGSATACKPSSDEHLMNHVRDPTQKFPSWFVKPQICDWLKINCDIKTVKYQGGFLLSNR